MNIDENFVSAVIGEDARRNLKKYIKATWHVVEPSTPFQDGYHVDAICEHLTHLDEIRNLLICIPPRMGKTTITGVMFPSWHWLHKPQTRFIYASYAKDRSLDTSVKCRRLIESNLYQRTFGYKKFFTLTSDQNTKSRFENNQTGFRLATSVDGVVTGEGGDILIIDDPHNLQEIESKANREAVIRWFSEVWQSRLDQPKTGCKIVVCQRGHPLDLANHIIKSESGQDWCKLILPMEYKRSRSMPTSLPWQDPRKEEGELLAPERMGEKEVASYRRSLGKRAYEAQYNQNPQTSEDAIFKKENFQTYTPNQYDPTTCYRIAAVDLAISAKGDYTVIAVADLAPTGEIYIVHLIRERMSSTKIVPSIEAVNKAYQPLLIFIEDVAFQKLVIDQCRQLRIPVKGVKPVGDKVSRSVLLQCKFEALQFFMPKDAPWREQAEEELSEFPGGAHDDIPDTFSYLAQEAERLMRHPPQWKQEVKPLTKEEAEKQAIKKAAEREWAMINQGIPPTPKRDEQGRVITGKVKTLSVHQSVIIKGCL